jgi:hypothetical protein
MIEMNLDDKVSEGLKGIGESFDKLLEQLRDLHEGLSSTLLAGAAVGLVLGLNKIASAADELVDSLAKLKVAGEDIEEAMMAAERATAHVPGTTAASNVELIRRLGPLMGGARPAEEMLPQLSMADYWMKQYGHPGGLDALTRVGKARGLEGWALRNFIEEQTRVVQATGGVYDPAQLLQASRRGGIVGAGFSESFLSGAMPWLQMQMGPGREQVGSQLAKLEESLARPGKLHGAIDPKAWQTYVASADTGIGAGRDRGLGLFAKDPAQWAQQLADAFKRKSYSDEMIRDVFGKLFTNQVVAQMMYQFAMNRDAIMGFQGRVSGAPGLSETAQLEYIRTNPMALKEAIGAEINKLFEQIARDVHPTYMKHLNFVYDELKELNTKMAGLDSRVMQDAFNAGIGLAGALTALSGMRLAWFLIGGGTLGIPLIAIAGGIAIALATMSDAQWKEALEALDKTSRGFAAWVNRMLGLGDETTSNLARAQPYSHYGTGPWSPRVIEDRLAREQEANERAIVAGPYGFARQGVGDQFMPKGSFGGVDANTFWGGPGGPVTFPRMPSPVSSLLLGNAGRIAYPALAPETMPLPQPRPFIPDAPTPSKIFQIPWPPMRGSPGMDQRDDSPKFGSATEPTFAMLPAPAPVSTSSMPSFSPAMPRSEQGASVNVQLNVDGRALGQVMMDRVLEIAEFSNTGNVGSHQAAYQGNPVYNG